MVGFGNYSKYPAQTLSFVMAARPNIAMGRDRVWPTGINIRGWGENLLVSTGLFPSPPSLFYSAAYQFTPPCGVSARLHGGALSGHTQQPSDSILKKYFLIFQWRLSMW